MKMIYEILPIILVVIASSLLLVKGIKKRNKESRKIVIQDVWDYFKENGYLKECQKGNYKFSTSRLRVLIKNEELHGISINHPEEATLVPGVGEKVYDLIKHLITKYKEENAINF